MTAILEARELYGHVDGTLTHPSASDSSSGEIASFEKAQKKTKALIVTSITSERDTIANKLFLKQRFFSLKMKEFALDEHLRKLKVITDQLASMN